ncbi:MAG: flagellar basal body-associated FliL family protein [Planctomycetes bacterium]|nr:flagellar basal body-associated FliL family protein [Planctomycetota bacterium]
MAEENKEQPKKKKSFLPIIVANVVVLGIVGYFVKDAFGSQSTQPKFMPTPYYEFNLDKVMFSVPATAGQWVQDINQISVKLSINPNYANISMITDDLKSRKSLIRDRIYDLLRQMAPQEFSEPDYIMRLKKKVKDVINIDIYSIKSSSEEIVKEVIIDDRVLPTTN